MAKKTLLEITQDILNDTDGDPVNSINDSTESIQIVQLLHTVYEELMASADWPHLMTTITLTASGTSSRPTHMSIPDGIQKMLWVKYDKHTSSDTDVKYQDVTYKEPEEFLNILNGRVESNSNVTKITDPSGIYLLIQTDTAPTYWTSFDDETIVFDSYDSDVDSTLQSSKTQARVIKETTWTVSDTFVPDMPSKYFPLLISEAKSTYFNSVIQNPNAKEEQKSRRQRAHLSKEKWRTAGGIKFPNYGRK